MRSRGEHFCHFLWLSETALALPKWLAYYILSLWVLKACLVQNYIKAFIEYSIHFFFDLLTIVSVLRQAFTFFHFGIRFQISIRCCFSPRPAAASLCPLSPSLAIFAITLPRTILPSVSAFMWLVGAKHLILSPDIHDLIMTKITRGNKASQIIWWWRQIKESQKENKQKDSKH